jgi:tetratricopeptide (TPR) repeat protein
MPGIDPTKMTVRVYEFVPGQSLAEFWVNLASANFENGHVADAVADYRKAVAADPAGMPGLTGLALALAELGQSGEAEAVFTRAGKVVSPASLAQFNFDFGRHCQSRGNYPAACAHFEAALKLAPGNPVPLNNLAWLLATAPQPELRDGIRALRLIRRALESSGDPAFLYYDTQAAVLAELGDFPKAVASEEQALGLAQRSGRNEYLTEMDQRRQLYAQHQPYRLPLLATAH